MLFSRVLLKLLEKCLRKMETIETKYNTELNGRKSVAMECYFLLLQIEIQYNCFSCNILSNLFEV